MNDLYPTMKRLLHSAQCPGWALTGSISLLLLVATCATPGAANPPAAAANNDPSELFFRQNPVPHFLIEVTGTNLTNLRQDNRKYVRATVKVGTNVYSDVGIHLKGAAGSFRGLDDKPALTLNFDKFHNGQRFHGMDKLHLNNSVQDSSYLTEILCGEMFLTAGVPAARAAHARVTLNGRDRGFYVLKEGFDKTFLKRHFANVKGNLYDGGFLREVTDPLERNSGDGPDDHADLKALARAAEVSDPTQRLAQMEQRLDVDRFLSFIALEIMTHHWDGYALKRNNYRIYHDPDSDKIVFIPHGMDQMFQNADFPILPNMDGLVARAIVTTPDGRKRYLERVAKLYAEVFRVETLTNRINELEAQIQPALEAMSPGAARNQADAANYLRHRIIDRAKSLARQLGLPPPAKQ